jgi:hypothetical protein
MFCSSIQLQMDIWVVTTFLSVVNSAIVTICVQIFVQYFPFLGALLSHKVILLNCLRNYQTIFHKTAHFTSLTTMFKNLIFQHPCQYLSLSSFSFVLIAFLVDAKCIIMTLSLLHYNESELDKYCYLFSSKLHSEDRLT